MEYNRRNHHRSSHFSGEAKLSRDGKIWHHARIDDVSSGGLSLYSTVEYDIGDELWFDVHMEGFFSEFMFKTKGVIRRKKQIAGDNIYGVELVGLSQDLKIFIDESSRRDRPVGSNPYDND